MDERKEARSEIDLSSNIEDVERDQFVVDKKSLLNFVFRNVKNTDDKIDDLLDDAIIDYAANIFMNGSQIHQSASILLYMGLPIIKLDGLYRGMFNVYDTKRLARQIDRDEGHALEQLLLARPFGGSTLIGWKKAAFLVGLI